jgi:hypothetical protein
MATRMQQRRGTEEQWTLANPVLAAGEIGLETDTNKFKIGDGVNNWEGLSYFVNADGLSNELEGYILETEKGAALGVATLDDEGQVPAEQLGNATVDLAGYATEEYVDTAIENVVGLAPETLDTLAELATALGDDPAAITTLQSEVATLQSDKADTNSPTFTGLTDFEGIVDFSEAVVIGIDALPDQDGNSGKYLTTDGQVASWQTVASPTPHPFSMIG